MACSASVVRHLDSASLEVAAGKTCHTKERERESEGMTTIPFPVPSLPVDGTMTTEKEGYNGRKDTALVEPSRTNLDETKTMADRRGRRVTTPNAVGIGGRKAVYEENNGMADIIDGRYIDRFAGRQGRYDHGREAGDVSAIEWECDGSASLSSLRRVGDENLPAVTVRRCTSWWQLHPRRRRMGAASSSSTLVRVLVLSLLFVAVAPSMIHGLAFASSSQSPTSSSLEASSASSSIETHGSPPQQQQPKKQIPITILSGFLGSGKTTLLQHLLHNSDGVKIALIVNDVASINIDSKLVKTRNNLQSQQQPQQPAGIVQLENGCACCSLSDELLASVAELVTLSDLRAQAGEEEGGEFDHIVVELSGVAEPGAVRANFQEAAMYGMPLLERVRLDTLVTVVDCGSYLQNLRSARGATPKDAPELFYRTDEERLAAEEQEDWTVGLPTKLMEALNAAPPPSPTESSGRGQEQLGVADLLVEQTEIADVVLLNKVDLLLGDEEGNADASVNEDEVGGSNNKGRAVLDEIRQIVQALNPRATVLQTSYGKVGDISDVLGCAAGMGAADSGVVDDHKDAVLAALASSVTGEIAAGGVDAPTVVPEKGDAVDHSHSHDHDEGDCDQTSSSSSSTTAQGMACADPDCTDPSHSHDHSHSDTHTQSHSHDHQVAADDSSSCTDPGCTDPTHDHSHTHHHHGDGYDEEGSTAIGTFVYRARRPFHPGRLMKTLRLLPVSRGVSPLTASPNYSEAKDVVGEDHPTEVSTLDVEKTRDTFGKLLRSKGFCWLANSDVAAMYWSHAGSSFEMQCLGRWWATLSSDQWPLEARETILADFDDPSADTEEDPTSSSVGDRRQELVFIGTGMGAKSRQETIRRTLDACLLCDDEYETYRDVCRGDVGSGEDRLPNAFGVLPLEIRMLTY